jgi:uncharacterized protein
MTGPPLGAPLTYPVSSLLRKPPGTTRTYPVHGVTIDLGADLELADPIEGEIRLTRTNRGLLVHGRLNTALASLCSRCLRDIEVPLEVEIDEEALPSVDIDTGQPADLSAEPEVIRLNGQHELELEPVVREAIQLAEPIAALCREDCPGLCATCGEELTGPPHEHEEEIDPRLEALRAFMVDAEARTH